MTKSLILVISCVKHELKGINQAIRDTWLPDAKALDFDVRFFIGDGTTTGEDESVLLNSFNSRTRVFQGKITEDPDISLMPVQSDQVILNIPDGYIYSTHKFREACRWAFKQGFDYVFQVLTDTFVVPSRLASCGFEKHDYIGTANNERTAIGGGAGMWLSRKAIQHLVNAPVDMWVHDGWVGKILLEKGIDLTHDPRYTNLGQQEPPMKSNDAITSHIANTPTVYDPKIMYKLHREFYGE
jgi:hypothetical protein